MSTTSGSGGNVQKHCWFINLHEKRNVQVSRHEPWGTNVTAPSNQVTVTCFLFTKQNLPRIRQSPKLSPEYDTVTNDCRKVQGYRVLINVCAFVSFHPSNVYEAYYCINVNSDTTLNFDTNGWTNLQALGLTARIKTVALLWHCLHVVGRTELPYVKRLTVQ